MDLSTKLGESFASLTQAAIAYLPRLILALAALALGWMLGRLFRMLALRLVKRLRRTDAGGSVDQELRASGLGRLAPQVIGGLAFWVVFVFFLAAAVEIAGLQVITTSLGRLVQYLPSVLAGVLVVLAGIVLGNLALRGVTHAVARAGLGHGEWLGRLARIAILLVAGVIALDQIGIESSVLIIAVAVLLGTVVGGAALAFGLGARTSIEGAIAAHYAGQNYRPGDRVRVGAVTGQILEFTRTAVLLDTPDGRAMVPAAEFDRSTTFLLGEGEAQ